VFDWAKAAGFRSGENPVDGVAKGLPRQSDEPDHHAALPYVEVPHSIERLQASGSAESVQLAFEFLILTATRTNEVLGATWDEIDQSQQLWTIPAKRMIRRTRTSCASGSALPRHSHQSEGARQEERLPVSEPLPCPAAVEHGFPDGAAPHADRCDGAWVPLSI
jgi:integrase